MITKNYLQFSKSLTLHTNTQHANVHVRRGKKCPPPFPNPTLKRKSRDSKGENKKKKNVI